MDKRLTKLINQFARQGLIITLTPKPDQMFIQFPGFRDYGATVTLEAGEGMNVTVWESYAGTSIGMFWTASLKELIPLALLKIVTYDTALANLALP